MATRYADFIKIQEFLPVYDMTDEMPNLWQTFIPTHQFCDLLSRSITAITSSDISKRRSMWVRVLSEQEKATQVAWYVISYVIHTTT